MINFRVDIDQRRISRIITNIRNVRSRSFLEKIDLDKAARRALRTLKAHFPHDRGYSRREFGIPLNRGWQVATLVSSNSIGFTLQNILDTNPRARTVLDSLDQGNRAYDYIVTNLIRFKDNRPNTKTPWVTLVPGRVVHHHARAGSYYVDKTYSFIVATLIPQLREEIQRKAKRLVES